VTRRAFALTLPVVLLGGALGGLARHAVDVYGPHEVFPWGTLLINVVGAVLLALLPALPPVQGHPWAPAFLGPGVLSGFTTLSAFSEQSRELAHTGHTGLAASYVALTVGAALAGALAVRHLTTPEQRALFHEEEGDE
jgi:CrcB protein